MNYLDHPKVKAANTILKTFSTKENQELVRKAINKIADLYLSHRIEVQCKIDCKDFSDVEGLDFNAWGHDALNEIEDSYFELLIHYKGLQYQQDGLSIIELN